MNGYTVLFFVIAIFISLYLNEQGRQRALDDNEAMIAHSLMGSKR